MNQAENGSTREEQAIRALQSGVLPSLQRNFQTRLYRFDTRLTRIASPTELGPAAASATHIGASLEQLVTQTGDLPLGAVVLLSDGGDNAGGVDRHAIDALRNRRVPVYTVGFGAEQVAQDVEIEDVVVASRVLAGSRLTATVEIPTTWLRRTEIHAHRPGWRAGADFPGGHVRPRRQRPDGKPAF